jgi:hypothetical protein
MVKASIIRLNTVISGVLESLSKDREQDIIIGRFGLNGKKNTLDKIGKEYDVTRERIRQLERGIIIRLEVRGEEGKIPALASYCKEIEALIIKNGGILSASHALELSDEQVNEKNLNRIIFLATISHNLTILNADDDAYNLSIIANSAFNSPADAKNKIDSIVNALESHQKPSTIQEIHDNLLPDLSLAEITAALKVSSKSFSRREQWGLRGWSEVNPKSVKDKIYIVLKEKGDSMHFSEIHRVIINDDEFKKRQFTVQAAHNELIKDNRFVLVGRGRYALSEWGFVKGTVSDVIERILKQIGTPMHRDEIIKEVLKQRQVKETTIVLNMQNKSKFKRVSTATFDLADK